MSLEFLENENYISRTISVREDNIWYTIDYPTINFVDNVAVIDPQWVATRHKKALGPAEKVGNFDSFEEAKAACDEDLASLE